jgi:hypothetical protein
MWRLAWLSAVHPYSSQLALHCTALHCLLPSGAFGSLLQYATSPTVTPWYRCGPAINYSFDPPFHSTKTPSQWLWLPMSLTRLRPSVKTLAGHHVSHNRLALGNPPQKLLRLHGSIAVTDLGTLESTPAALCTYPVARHHDRVAQKLMGG